MLLYTIFLSGALADPGRQRILSLNRNYIRYQMRHTALVFIWLITASAPLTTTAQTPDTLKVMDIPANRPSDIPDEWYHVRPEKNRASTNYSIEEGRDGLFLRALSSGTSSWLELKMDDLDVSRYQIMEWSWMVNQFPETEWEMNKQHDDFAIRIELEYNFKGSSWNILNIIRKGLITTIFRRYPPELVISYVWSLNVPPDEPYESPTSNKTMIIPIESDVAMQGRWVSERRNIYEDLVKYKGEKTRLVLKKIRIAADTESVPTVSESGIKHIYLIDNK